VLDCAPDLLLAYELEEAVPGELAHRDSDRAERGAKLLGELARAGGPVFKQAEDLDAQRVRECLDDCWV